MASKCISNYVSEEETLYYQKIRHLNGMRRHNCHLIDKKIDHLIDKNIYHFNPKGKFIEIRKFTIGENIDRPRKFTFTFPHGSNLTIGKMYIDSEDEINEMTFYIGSCDIETLKYDKTYFDIGLRHFLYLLHMRYHKDFCQVKGSLTHHFS
jgi:hypothetical protein